MFSGIYRYRKSQNTLPETPVKPGDCRTATDGRTGERGCKFRRSPSKADTEDKENDEAKIETRRRHYKIGEAELAQTEETAPEEQPEEQPETQADAQTSLLSFADNSKLMWPVSGNVILNYSMDKSIYFETLNQYKYHPAIVIGSGGRNGSLVCSQRRSVRD